MRLPNAKTLLCWPSRMQIYGLVENHTFLEQFVSRGVPGHFFQSGGTFVFKCFRTFHRYLKRYDYSILGWLNISDI